MNCHFISISFTIFILYFDISSCYRPLATIPVNNNWNQLCLSTVHFQSDRILFSFTTYGFMPNSDRIHFSRGGMIIFILPALVSGFNPVWSVYVGQ